MSKVIVIGAGASGVIAALKASERNEVILLEKNDKCLKKLLLTGNGKCNFWHENINIQSYNTDDIVGLNEVLQKEQEVYEFLESIGLYPLLKDDLYYPYSESSLSVKELFLKALERKKVVVYNDVIVKNITSKDGKFIISSENGEYLADKVVLATGSKAYPKTGSDGFSYIYANKLNLNVNPVLPALTSLKTNKLYIKQWNGLRVNAKVILLIDNKYVDEEVGNLQLTDYGLSGICIFNLSGKVSKALYNKKSVCVAINFLPFCKDVDNFLYERSKMLLNFTISEILESIFHYKLVSIFFKESGINGRNIYHNLSLSERQKLCKVISNFEVPIIDVSSFDKSQVCTGGISLKEINVNNMMCKKIPNLYLVGEMLDVDGICGGYNLAFAFMSGYLAGKDTLND